METSLSEQLVQSTPYLGALIALVLAFLAFLWRLLSKMLETAKEMQGTFHEVVSAVAKVCHDNHKETIDKVAEVVERNTAAIVTNSRIQGQVLQKLNGSGVIEPPHDPAL
jgi:hypothetical protein